ncbi:transcriptional regulator [Thermococcus sp.]|uniref:sulfur metabolism transcriptional regulator SurR n=1 Tax=Thermococcus sp. TaxID=35749 RepID=UPI0025E3B100|nr:transcriptional regulator [Thermococcus sp.]
MDEPDIFYILGNKVRRDLLSHLTCTECYFSFLSSKVSVSSTAVAKHLKIMEREGILKSYEREGPFIGPARKYYDINIAKTYVVTITPNIFWYRGLDLKEDSESSSDHLEEQKTLGEMILTFRTLSEELENVLRTLQSIENKRDRLMAMIKEKYLREIGDMTQLAILHYVLLNGKATVEELSDRLNLKEREVLAKVNELDKFVPLRIKDDTLTIDDERLKAKLGGEDHAGED